MKKMMKVGGGVLLLAGMVLASISCGMASEPPTLETVWKALRGKKFVDLTHAFAPGIPHWKNFPDEKREVLYWYEPGVGSRGSGFYVQSFSHVGQWGTHVDPPAHFVKGLRTVDQIDPKEMILPLVVIDVHQAVAGNPDYTITMQDIEAWERRHGEIPEGAFVAMRTDWSKRWPDLDAMQNKDANGIAHYPGWSREVLEYLYEVRKITASGHETTDTDPGIATSKDDYALEAYILGKNHYQIELLAHLDEVPEAGALVVATFPKPKDARLPGPGLRHPSVNRGRGVRAASWGNRGRRKRVARGRGRCLRCASGEGDPRSCWAHGAREKLAGKKARPAAQGREAAGPRRLGLRPDAPAPRV